MDENFHVVLFVVRKASRLSQKFSCFEFLFLFSYPLTLFPIWHKRSNNLLVKAMVRHMFHKTRGFFLLSNKVGSCASIFITRLHIRYSTLPELKTKLDLNHMWIKILSLLYLYEFKIRDKTYKTCKYINHDTLYWK